jgi:large subunit ribosomal protein L45
VYDRFGRLSHGSEVIAKDVLEYVVFEKHVANEYGLWRVHAKIIPPWMQVNNENPRTFKVAN